jgi:hypothetical protein
MDNVYTSQEFHNAFFKTYAISIPLPHQKRERCAQDVGGEA